MTFLARRRMWLACALACLLGLAGPGRALAHQIALGAYIPGATWHPGLIERFGRRVGRDPVIVSSYQPWTVQPFAHDALANVWNAGAVPMVTWEPWNWSSGRGFSLRGIVQGRFDEYARRAARSAARWKHPLLLRFAHEMNGNWYPWGTGHGNTPATYKHAWRHLVRIFRQEGATNVAWVWTPNVDNHGKYPFRQFYPGGAWVDWVGLDGFNWGSQSEWLSFRETFAQSYRELTRFSQRPMMISEVGCSARGGDKAAWVSRALRIEIPRMRRIRAVVWFDEPFAGIDARVDSSPRSLRAFRVAAPRARYGMSRAGLTAASVHLRQPAAPR